MAHPQTGVQHRLGGRHFRYHITAILVPTIIATLIALTSAGFIGADMCRNGTTRTGIGYILVLLLIAVAFLLAALSLLTVQSNVVRSSLAGACLCFTGFGLALAASLLGMLSEDRVLVNSFIPTGLLIIPWLVLLAAYRFDLAIRSPGYTSNWEEKTQKD